MAKASTSTKAKVRKLYDSGIPTYIIAKTFDITEAKVIRLLGL